MKLNEASQECKNCQYFDRERKNGEKVGETVTEFGMVGLGFCRVNKGLVFGSIPANNKKCKHSPPSFLAVERDINSS